MKLMRHICPAARLAALALVAGCNRDEIKTPESPDASARGNEISQSDSFPSLEGAWNGTYVRPDDYKELSAHISQGGAHVTILTSLAGEGQLFTGYFKSNGALYFVDASSDEIWTSTGSISDHQFTIQDYLVTAGNRSDPPLQVIRFSR